MSTGDDLNHLLARNGEFCVTIGPTRTAGILAKLVKGAGRYGAGHHAYLFIYNDIVHKIHN